MRNYSSIKNNYIKISRIILATIILLMSLCFKADVKADIMLNYYVSPSGSDSNPGTEAQPFKTIQKARDVVRTKTAGMTGDIYVWIRGGTYELTETLTFDERDSGKNGHYVVYMAYPGERPIISGGTKITGWSHWADGIYRAQCPNVEFRQLYVNGEKAIRARTPNAGTYNRLVSWDTSNRTIRVYGSEFDTSWQNYSFGKIEMVVQQYWAESIMRISSVATNGSYKDITVNNTERNIVFNREWPQKSPDQAYHFENSYSFIDEGGEWYLDNNYSQYYVYYKPRAGENMSSVEVVAPIVETLVKVEGSGLGTKASNLIFYGMTFEHSNWNRPSFNGNIGLQQQQYSIGNDQCARPAAAFFVKNA